MTPGRGLEQRAAPAERAPEAGAPARPLARSGWVATVVAAWLLSLGFDLLLHGGLLARLYLEPSPFLLPPEEAFRRIPLGYLAFLLLTGALGWLVWRLQVRGAGAGLRLGAGAGAILWAAFGAGLYSISTAGLPLLAAWWVGQSVELGLAGAVLGAAAGGTPLRRIWIVVGTAVLLCVAAVVALQSLGLAPAVRAGT